MERAHHVTRQFHFCIQFGLEFVFGLNMDWIWIGIGLVLD